MSSSVQQSDAGMFVVLKPHLAAERLRPFLVAADGNGREAIRLYQWNIELSGAVYEALHVVEVVLRNAMDHQLRGWNARQRNQHGDQHSADWLLDPAPLLRRLVRPGDFDRARSRAEQAIRGYGREICHADVLAQVSWGTWRHLLPSQDPGRLFLWEHALVEAFVHLDREPRQFVGSVDRVYRLRNRVAHLEPLLRDERVRRQFDDMRVILRSIDPAAERWFVSIQRVTVQLRRRPVRGGPHRARGQSPASPDAANSSHTGP